MSSNRSLVSRAVVAIWVALALCAAPANAFDGKLKGLSFGFGFGYTPYLHFTYSSTYPPSSYTGPAFHLFAGYAFDNQNLVALGHRRMSYRTGWIHMVATQKLNCVQWFHFFGKGAHRLYSTVGVGEMQRAYQVGYMAGLGWEFSKHNLLEVTLIDGQTLGHPDFRTHTVMINLLLKYIVY